MVQYEDTIGTTVRILIFVRLASLGERSASDTGLGWYDMKTLDLTSDSYYSNDSNKSIFTNDSKLLFLGTLLLGNRC